MKRKPKLDFVNDEFNHPHRHHPTLIGICFAVAIALGAVRVMVN